MAQVDLAIRGGRIVTETAVVSADLGICAGVVTQIGEVPEADAELDARGALVLPGGIDAHVHLSATAGSGAEPDWVDDFTTGSAAALAGGITTLGNMTSPAPGERPIACLQRTAAQARRQTIADLFLHPILPTITPAVLEEIPH